MPLLSSCCFVRSASPCVSNGPTRTRHTVRPAWSRCETLASTPMQGVTMAFFEDVWSRNFLNLFATPLSLSEYLTGLVSSSIATSAVGLVVMVLMATLAFGLSFFIYGLMFVPFILILFLSGIALGIFN